MLFEAILNMFNIKFYKHLNKRIQEINYICSRYTQKNKNSTQHKYHYKQPALNKEVNLKVLTGLLKKLPEF